MNSTTRAIWLLAAAVTSGGGVACGTKDGLVLDPHGDDGGTRPEAEADRIGDANLGVFSGSDATAGTEGGTFVCNPNPANYDIPGNGCDDDGNGKVDDVRACDNGSMPPSSLASAGTAADMLAALGICQTADSTRWGVVSATYTNGHSQTGPGVMNFAQQHGTLPKFGNVIVPREGSRLGVLSTGSATEFDSDFGPLFTGNKNGMQGPGGLFGPNGGDVPPGFPKTTTGCPTLNGQVNDVVDVKIQLKVPANAQGFSFDFDFFSGEWPIFVCSTFNDEFIAYLKSSAFNGGTPDNISFDPNKSPISVNSNFFQACTPGTQTDCTAGAAMGRSTCSLGEAQLAGTGFGQDTPEAVYCGSTKSTSGGSTGWLTSTAPVTPGEMISLEFIIWDTGDHNVDSSVLLDHWAWQPKEVLSMPMTTLSPPPK